MEPNALVQQKYIRTFAGDMETVKKGGTPNLKALSSPDATEGAAPLSTSTPESISLPATPILPSQLTGHLSVPMSVIPQPVLPPPLVALPPPPPPKPPAPSPLETYSGDFSDQLKKSNASTATVLAVEQDALRGAPTISVKESRSQGGVWYVAGGIALLVIGAVGAYYAYTQYLVKSAPVIITPVVSAPIFVDQSEEISGTGAVLAQAIQESLVRPLASGTVRFLYRPLITSAGESIFIALQLPAPDMLLRNITTAGSMAGVIQTDNASPFFILSVTSYTDTFAAMLAWEPRMPRDLGTLFIPAPSLATSTLKSLATSTPVTFIFYDEVIANHDARVYRDSSGAEQIVYGYWNQNTLVIARDTFAFSEIISRLATSRKQ